MRLVVIGGHSRNIGKTSAACALIAATRRWGWTAVKISQFGHGVCSANGKPCGCAVDDVRHPFAIDREIRPDGGSDTSRMLAAGAREVFWLRAPQGRLEEAAPLLRQVIETSDAVLIESTSAAEWLRPDLFLHVLDPAVADWKASSRRLAARADAQIVVGDVAEGAGCEFVGDSPRFQVARPVCWSPALEEFALDRLGAAASRPDR